MKKADFFFLYTYRWSSVRSWWFCCGDAVASGAGVLFGVIREVGGVDSEASSDAAAELSSVGSAHVQKVTINMKSAFRFWKNSLQKIILFSIVFRYSGRTLDLQHLLQTCSGGSIWLFLHGDDWELTCLFKALQVFLPVPADLSHQGLAVWGRTLKLLQPFLKGVGGLQQRSWICGKKREKTKKTNHCKENYWGSHNRHTMLLFKKKKKRRS